MESADVHLEARDSDSGGEYDDDSFAEASASASKSQAEAPGYYAELSPSGTAACRKCDDKIAKGHLRIGKFIEAPHGFLKRWHHAECFVLPSTDRGRVSPDDVVCLGDDLSMLDAKVRDRVQAACDRTSFDPSVTPVPLDENATRIYVENLKKKKIKKNVDAFGFFKKAMRPEFKKKHPGSSTSQITTMLKNAWEELDDTSRYDALAADDLARYEGEIALQKDPLSTPPVSQSPAKKQASPAKRKKSVPVEPPPSEADVSDPVWIKYAKMTIGEKKEWLRANRMFVTGKSAELTGRCYDGEKRGRLPPLSAVRGRKAPHRRRNAASRKVRRILLQGARGSHRLFVCKAGRRGRASSVEKRRRGTAAGADRVERRVGGFVCNRDRKPKRLHRGKESSLCREQQQDRAQGGSRHRRDPQALAAFGRSRGKCGDWKDYSLQPGRW